MPNGEGTWTIVTMVLRNDKLLIHAYDIYTDRSEAMTSAKDLRKKHPKVLVRVVKIIEGLSN